MGDIADMALDQGIMEMLDGDFEYEASNAGWHTGFRNRRAPSRNLQCRYCGQTGLHWEAEPDGWRLFDEDDEIHACLTKPKSKQQRRKAVGLFTRNPIYVSDRGDEFQLENMEPSHLLNAINHHKTQIETLDWILEQTGTDAEKNQMLHLRRISLHTTVEALVKELRNRDPDLDHEDRL